MKNKEGFHIGAGITSIFMLFIVLCLTVFAILSYGNAKAGYELSKQASDNLDIYYQARNKAVRDVALINESVMNDKKNANKEEFIEKVRSSINEKGYNINDKGNVEISVKINDNQTLEIELKINDYSEKTGVTILRSYISAYGQVTSQGVPIITE